MKIKAFYLSAVAAIVTGLVSCDNAELKYDDVTGPGRLFLNEAVGTAKSVSVRHSRRRQRLHGHAPHLENRWAGT